MFNLIVNSNNVANSLNNMYQYNFKGGVFTVPENAEIMITSFQIPYSWYNISTRYNNVSRCVMAPVHMHRRSERSCNSVIQSHQKYISLIV